MKKGLKKKLILLFVAVCALFLLAGCSFNQSLDDVNKKYDLTAQITYLANGGEFEDGDTQKVLRYKSGSKALNIGKVNPSSGNATVTRENYDFDCWYEVETDSEGNPVAGEAEGTYKLKENKFDFSKQLEEGDEIVLGASWLAHTKVDIRLVVTENENAELPLDTTNASNQANPFVSGKDSVKQKETVNLVSYTDGEVRLKDSMLPAVTGYTFVNFYFDEACTEPAKSVEQGETDVVVYARYVEGAWTVVREASQARAIFSESGSSGRYWLTDSFDLSKYAFTPLTSFTGEIRGNGYKLQGMKVSATGLSNATVSLFGAIGENAKISDLTLENITFTYTVMQPSSIYAVCSSIAEGASIENVSVSYSMSITKPASVTLSNFGSPESYTKCLFGGFASDEAYTAAYPNGFKVSGTAAECITITNTQ